MNDSEREANAVAIHAVALVLAHARMSRATPQTDIDSAMREVFAQAGAFFAVGRQMTGVDVLEVIRNAATKD